MLEKCIAALDNAQYCLTFASGLGAIASAMYLLSKGDHILLGDDIFGGTSRLIKSTISRSGIAYTFADPLNVDKFVEAITPETKMVWLESPTNPTLKVIDIERISKLLKGRNILLAVDNSFMSCYFQHPLELGADLAIYSLTKYMNGHADVIMGAITCNSKPLYDKLKYLQRCNGAVPSPIDCYQVKRGLKSLPLRMERHMKNGLAIAKYLEKHPMVDGVLHPGLPSSPFYKLAKQQNHGVSSCFSFYIKGGLAQAKAFLMALKTIALAESLGGYETTIQLPSLMTHSSVSKEELQRLGITDTLIRISVGLEDPEDMIEDLENAFRVAKEV